MIWRAQSVRSKLSRLGNIASIVAITCVEDLEDYDLLLSPAEPVTSNTAAKKLSQAEAVQLLKVRSSRQRLNSLLVAHCSHEMCQSSSRPAPHWPWLCSDRLQRRVDFPRAELQKLM